MEDKDSGILEGTFKAPKLIQEYLDKHLKHCLSKEEWEAQPGKTCWEREYKKSQT